ncbi:MAG: bifunctional DNA primase/polymerase [Nitrososphaerota archaeon]
MQKTSEFLELYISRGLTPIPLERGGKTPILREWPNVSREEALKAFEYLEDYNVGLRIEPPICVLDIDDRRLVPLILDEISQTWIVETRRGCHVYLKAPEDYYPHTNKKSKLIQLLAEGCQAVAPPSIVEGHEYRFRVNPSNCEIAKLDENKVKLLERIINSFMKYEAMILEFARLWTEGHRHNLSLWLNGALRKSGIERFEAAVIVKSICLLAGDPELKDRLTALKTTYERPIEELGAWSYLKRELESIVGPEQAAEILKLFPAKDEEVKREAAEKPRKIKVSKPLRIGDALIEPLECGLVVCRNGCIEVRETYEHEGHILVKDPWLDGVVRLPPEPMNIEPKALWNMTRRYIEEYVYLEDLRLYDVLTAFIGWSYFYDQNSVTCYLYINGPYGSGKTRLLEVLRMLCYRGVLSSIARGPSLFRLIERLGSLTLLIDESMIRDKDVSDLLRVGYRRGNVIIRAEKENDGFELRKFETYCLKAFASVEEPSEDIKQRSLTINMIKNLRPVGKKLDENMARGIRGGWLYQRLTNKIEVTGNEYASRYQDARFEEICSPLMAIALRFNPEAAEAIKGYFEELEETRAAEIRATLEAEIIEYLLKRDYDESGCTFVSVSDLVTAFNNRYSDRKIGRAMSRLGFKKRRDKTLGRGYEIDRNLLRKLAIIYRIEAPSGDGAINQLILGS